MELLKTYRIALWRNNLKIHEAIKGDSCGVSNNVKTNIQEI